MAEASIWDGYNMLNYFLGMVEYNFTLWNHLKNPLELSSIDEKYCVVEAEVAQEKSNLDSLPLGENQAMMTTVMTKTKEITATQVE
jgi:hypothetical protein